MYEGSAIVHHRGVTTLPAREPSAFASAADRVLALLADRLGLGVAAVSRHDGGDHVVLHVFDSLDIGLSPGRVAPWDDTLCAIMARETEPCLVADVLEVPQYAEAVTRLGHDVRAYAGVALRDREGRLLGSLCALSPEPKPGLADEEELFSTLGTLLASLLDSELHADDLPLDPTLDPLTGLWDRAGWDTAITTVESRCARLGAPAAVFAFDVDGLTYSNERAGHETGDAVLRQVATILEDVLRSLGQGLVERLPGGLRPVAARTGGDEFAVLVPDLPASAVDVLTEEFAHRLLEAGLRVSLGGVARRIEAGLLTAWHEADELMVADKRRRRRMRVVPLPRAEQPEPTPLAPSAGADSADAQIALLLQRARHVLGLETAFVSEHADGQQLFRHVSTDTAPLEVGHRIPLEETLCAQILSRELPEVIVDARAEPRAQVSSAVRAGLIGAYVGVPVRLEGGVLYGTLCAFDSAARPGLDNEAAAVLKLLAAEIAGLLDGKRAEQARRHRLLADLDALARSHQPRIALQPVVDLRTGDVLAYEALSRFDDGRGPDVWFAEAAAAGAGVRLELAAFDNALALQLPPQTQLCVNLSSEVIVSGPLQRRLAAIAELDAARLRHLVIELTEHEAVSDYASVDIALRPWRERGLRLAIDDTGAGHSSLTHVLRLQPDVVKLDRLLITELDHDPVRRSLVKALTGFCGEVGILLIAEGVENAAELACLQELGVPYAQGYHLGRPALAVPRDAVGTGARTGA